MSGRSSSTSEMVGCESNLHNVVHCVRAAVERGLLGRNADARVGGHSWGIGLLSAVLLSVDMVLSYFTKSATPAQQSKWLPRIVAEGSVIAIAMSEPEIGSDLAALATTAKRSADGKSFILNGRKMWSV